MSFNIGEMDGKKGGYYWAASHIILLTPEIEENIRNVNLISKCRKMFENKDLTADQVERILAILTEKTENE